MKVTFVHIALAVLVLATLACGQLPNLGGPGAGGQTPVSSEESDSGLPTVVSPPLSGGQGGEGEVPQEGMGYAGLEELNSYRLEWQIVVQNGDVETTSVYQLEWTKEPLAAHLVWQMAPDMPPVEYILADDTVWMKAGGTWVVSSRGEMDELIRSAGEVIEPEEGMQLTGHETVNGIRCKHYVSEQSVPGTPASRHEVWVADQSGLPPVVIRGFFAMENMSMESNVTDINAPIVIEAPGEAEVPLAATAVPDAGSATPLAESSPANSSERTRAVDGMLMRLIPSGEFVMGDDGSPFGPEKPAHVVYLDAFWIDETEVTNAQYRSCVEAGACGAPGLWDDAAFSDWTDDRQPVLVSWSGAQTYCQWAGGRLPTEAEWEKAARGTDGRLWPWGNSFVEGRANLKGEEDGYAFTAPVGMFPGGASPYGLLDMAGNAAEWVADWYAADYYAAAPARNPTGPAGGEKKVIRGTVANGGGGQEKCRTVARFPADPEPARATPIFLYGFRCVMTTSP